MAGINMKGLYQESGYRIRYQESLIGQIEKDHADVNRLWDRLQKGTISTAEEKDLRKTICWLRKELTTYKKLENTGIEGLTSAKAQEIEDDLINKERVLQYNPN